MNMEKQQFFETGKKLLENSFEDVRLEVFNL